MVRLIRNKVQFYQSLNKILDYYDMLMIKHNNNKIVAREELFLMFKNYYEWLQGKK